MNESPRQRFQKTSNAKLWLDVADSPQFKSAADASMLQYGLRLGYPKDMVEAAANEFRRQGAREFLDMLTNIAVVGEPEPKVKAKGVDHSV